MIGEVNIYIAIWPHLQEIKNIMKKINERDKREN